MVGPKTPRSYALGFFVITFALAGVWFLGKPVQADPPPARVVSNWETDTGNQLHRDCGYSTALPGDPGNALWIFCDTVMTDSSGNELPLPFRPGTWAAVGPFQAGDVPDELSHLPSPPITPTIPNDDEPQLLLPNPTGLVDVEGDDCSGRQDVYQATWSNGVTAGPDQAVTVLDGTTPMVIQDPSELLFVVYVEVCISDKEGVTVFGDLEGKTYGLAVYDPSDNSIVASSPLWTVPSPTDYLPSHQMPFHPTFHGDYMYMYAAECTDFSFTYSACMDGHTYALRAELDSLSEGSAYEYRTSTGWSSNVANAIDILDTTESLDSFMVHVGDFTDLGKGYLLMEQLTFGGDYRLWQAASPAGPWSLEDSDQMPCSIGTGGGCYHLWGHPELSEENDLLYSYYDKMDGFVHVVSIGTIPDF